MMLWTEQCVIKPLLQLIAVTSQVPHSAHQQLLWTVDEPQLLVFQFSRRTLAAHDDNIGLAGVTFINTLACA